MPLKICELLSLLLTALVTGMFWGPWLALTRSFAAFEPDVFLAIVRRMGPNMAAVMTVLMPAALLSLVPILFLSYRVHPQIFALNLAGLVLFGIALLVTMWVEVPIVTQIATWTMATLPDNWRERRDRWGAFHLIRLGASLAGLILLAIGAVYG